MMNRKPRAFISILVLISILLTTILSTLLPKQVNAYVLGDTGTIVSGGIAGPGGYCPAAIYRVGITSETLATSNQIKDNDLITQITAKLEDHYKNHFPSMSNSIMFSPSSCYTTDAAIGWWEPSSGELRMKRRNMTGGTAAERNSQRANHDARLRELHPTNSNPGNLYYAGLEARAPLNPVAPEKIGDMKRLINGGWKNVFNSVGSTAADDVWFYLLGNMSEANKRIKDYIGEDQMGTGDMKDQHKGRLKYLDLLMTLYALSPTGDQRLFYEGEIERFLKHGNDLGEKPITIAIDTAVRFSSPAQLGDTKVFIPSLHYVQWMHGGTPKTDLTSPSFPATTGAMFNSNELIRQAAIKAMQEAPKRKRNTDMPSDTDGFTWGYGGVVGSILRTNSKNATATMGGSSVTSPVMEALVFKGNMFGFMIAGSIHNKPKEEGEFDCKCTQAVALPNKKDVEGQLKTNIVGKKLNLTVNIKESDPIKRAEWKQLLDGTKPATLEMQVRLWRSGAPGSGQWQRVAGPAPATDAVPNTFTVLPKTQILGYLDGNLLSYNDDLMTYNVPNETTYEFKYNASVTIRGELLDGSTFSIACSPGNSQGFTIIGPTDQPIEKGIYTSFPEFWSEIKQGSPGNETFEAMSGTPTTRSLYFATGGSEFIVDIETEYVPDATSTRTYRSHFAGTPSEFKTGDQAKNYTVGGQSVNGHSGGSVTKTWSGSIPWTGSHSASGYHGGSVTNTWDYSAQLAAKAEADAWAAEVNATVVKHTAVSDGVTRSFSAWGASTQGGPSAGAPGTWTDGKDPVAAVPCSGDPCTGGSPPQPGVNAKSTAGTAGTYSYTVTGTMPARIIDGPSSIYDLPAIEDTWTQTITYDYTKINKAKVWKIDRSKVDGMASLTGTDELTASITAGDPSIFYNIANANTSAAGRLRYSVEPNQHDVVVWNEGTRTNKDDGDGHNGYVGGNGHASSWAHGINYTNGSYDGTPNYHASNSDAKDKASPEYAKFDERRKTLTEVTAVSDFLILQTSIGDQSVMYFEKTSPKAETQRALTVAKTSKIEQWDNNPLSAAKWSENFISIGSYNGKYYSPSTKYSSYRSQPIETIFDTYPAGMIKPASPTSALRLVKTDIDVIDTFPNGEYITGNSSVFYRNIVNVGGSTIYSTGYNTKYGANGVEFETAYSNSHQKVNDIVIYNPVSVEDAIVLPLSAARDQRTSSSKLAGGNLQLPTVDYERQLKANYRQNILSNGDAEKANLDGIVSGWSTWTSTPGSHVRFTSRSGDSWVMNGSRSFEINTTSHSDGSVNYVGVYYKDVTIKPNTQYKFDGNISCHRCTGYFYLDVYNSNGSVYQGGISSTTVVNTGAVTNKEISFTSGPNVNKVRIHMVKGNTNGGVSGSADYLFVDNLRLENWSTQEWIPTEPVYQEQEIPNPSYVPASGPVSQSFGFTGGAQSFTALKSGTYTLEVWGAEGGTNGGKGGYAKGNISLSAGEQLDLYVGGRGSDESSTGITQAGGWNGGGSSYGTIYGSATGGGATDIRKGVGALKKEWLFENSLHSWSGGTSAIGATSAFMNVSVTNSDGYFYSPSSLAITGEYADVIEMIVKNNSGGSAGQIYINNGGGYHEGAVQHFSMTTNDSAYQTITIPMGSNSQWSGRAISSFRVDIANGASSGNVEIKSIKIRTGAGLADRIIVAGGGGAGNAHGDKGGVGGGEFGGTSTTGGSGASQTIGFALGLGQSVSSDGHNGSGGGGYYGGYSTSTHPFAGGGGSGYIVGLASAQNVGGNLSMPAPSGGTQIGQTGNGYARITSPGSPAVGSPTIKSLVLVDPGSSEPPEEAYEYIAVTNNPSATVDSPLGSFAPGNFINLDYGFQIYFPDQGDFNGNGAYGLGSVSAIPGKGYTDNMDTTEWTASKQVRFAFYVTYNGKTYSPDQWIDLALNQETYNFYLPLANSEAISALVEFRVLAINGSYIDNDSVRNKVRYENLAAKHSAVKSWNIDIVGRIGAMVIEDTGDFRFSNLFKQPVTPTKWLVPNIVKIVNTSVQNRIIGDHVNIRGETGSAGNNYLDTYGLLPHLRQSPISLPLSPDKNNITALQRQPIRIGYNVLSDIQTIGNYYKDMQIIPYYYHLNLSNGSITPVDIYMEVNGSKKPINKFGAAVPGWDPSSIHQYIYSIDWINEASRRNYSESAVTDHIDEDSIFVDGNGIETRLGKPYGTKYAYGTAQIMYLTERNRTFIGSEHTYGVDRNPDGSLVSEQFNKQGQRWHFTYGLPSSSVAVRQGEPVSQANIDALRTKTSVLIAALDVKSIGDTYVLQYSKTNGVVNIAGTSWSLASIPHPVVAVYSANKSSADDLSVSGTH